MFCIFQLFLFLSLDFNLKCVFCDNYSFIDLPRSHLSYYFNNFPKISEKCLNDINCEYRTFLGSNEFNENICWGYEDNCNNETRFSNPVCPGDHVGWVRSKEAQTDTFYIQTDFGYVKQQREELSVMCEPLFATDSSLECSKNLRFCRGRNIMVNFTDLIHRQEPFRYKTDVLNQGQIGGFCKFHRNRLLTETDHLSALQSWAPELRYFEEKSERPIEAGVCDVVIDKPTIFMKIDATINMYHHFCDFFNLYASLHVNKSHPMTFDIDTNILVWETYSYNSPFAETFKAFTKNPILDLKTFRGEVVCFKNLMLPLLPRMIFGLYYNTPIINGCEKSGLFEAFSDHVLHRLNVSLEKRNSTDIRITLLSRQTRYRKILNENQLVKAIKNINGYDVNHVSYEKDLTFTQQLQISRNTDVLIGMHGAGLTHLLFLPQWAAVFELYNCEDPNCYTDLARLKGVKYITWEHDDKLEKEEDEHSDGGAHAKFANYRFNVVEFLRLVKIATDHVRTNKLFINYVLSSNSSHDEL